MGLYGAGNCTWVFCMQCIDSVFDLSPGTEKTFFLDSVSHSGITPSSVPGVKACWCSGTEPELTICKERALTPVPSVSRQQNSVACS